MKTKDALTVFKGEDCPSFSGPLADSAEHYSKMAAKMKAERELRDEEPQFDLAHMAALQKKLAEVNAGSILDSDLPALSLFDAYQTAKKASDSKLEDVGLRVFSSYLKRRWEDEPMGSLSIKEVANLRDRYTRNYPKTAVSSVIEANFPQVGYNTLPLKRLSDMADKIASQDDYNSVCDQFGLGGNSPEQVRSRSFVRGLVNMKFFGSQEDPYEADMPNPETGQQESYVELEDGSEELTAKPEEGGSVERVTASKVEKMLLNGEILEKNGNLIRVNPETDNIELWLKSSGNGGVDTPLYNLDRAVHDFLVESGYRQVSADVFEVDMPNPSTGQQDPVVTTVDPMDAGSDLGPDSQLAPSPEMDQKPEDVDPQGDFSDTSMGPDSGSRDPVELESDEEIKTHPNLVERQPGTEVPSETDLGPDSDSRDPVELESDEPILTSREGPTAGLNDDYFVNKPQEAKASYLGHFNKKPSEDLLRDITDPHKWAANQLVAQEELDEEELEDSEDSEDEKVAQRVDRKTSIRNAVKGKVLKKRADISQVGEGVLGGETYHYTFGFDSNIGLPTKDQMQHFLNDNSSDGNIHNIVAMSVSGSNMVNVAIKSEESREAGNRIREHWDGDKFSRDLEAESAEDVQKLHKCLNGEEVEWTTKDDKDAVDDSAKEYWTEYYDDGYGEALVEDKDPEVEETLNEVDEVEKEKEGSHPFVQKSQINNPRTPPAQDAISFNLSNKRVVGDRVNMTVSWDAEQVHSMSSDGLENRIKSYVLQEASDVEEKSMGFLGDVQVSDLDVEAGTAEVDYKSSEDSAPQLAPAHSAPVETV